MHCFEYQTESEIQYLVQLALEDALESQGLTDLLGVKPEVSVFACRPDIIVVYHSMRGIILVVEVKKPGVDVFTSHEVGGQLYDFLVGLLVTGIRPFGVLSSYDKTCIAYLNDGGVSRGILERVSSQLESEIPMGRIFGTADQKATSVKSSPGSKLRSVLTCPTGTSKGDGSLEAEEDDDEEAEEDDHGDNLDSALDDDDSEEDPDYDREVMYTPSFFGRDAIKGIILAVRCAIESLYTSEEKDVPLNGEGATGACALVNRTGLFWTNLPAEVNFDYYKFPAPSSKVFYLWKDLGRGSKGRVFLACNSTGKTCAAKFYLLDQALLHRQEDSPEPRKAALEMQMAARKAAADLECSRWTEAYRGEFSKQVRVVKLNNLWCLFMPYFDPVPKPDRKNVLPNVTTILLDFKNRGLRYADDELRWRHIGMRDGKVFLFDLGSLELDDARKPNVDDTDQPTEGQNTIDE